MDPSFQLYRIPVRLRARLGDSAAQVPGPSGLQRHADLWGVILREFPEIPFARASESPRILTTGGGAVMGSTLSLYELTCQSFELNGSDSSTPRRPKWLDFARPVC